MCQIQREREQNLKSLGLFKPKTIDEFISEPLKDRKWSETDKQKLAQMDFFYDKKPLLEKIPFKFKIQYTCLDSACNGHTQSLIDWETAQLYRNLKITCPTDVELINKMRQKYMDEVFSPDKDIYFIVGNQYEGPLSFLILSVFWPPIDRQIPLF